MSREKTRLFCPGTSDLNGTGKGLNWLGNVERMSNERVAKTIYKWKPYATRPKGRPRLRWEEDDRNDLRKMGVKNWKQRAQERKQWNEITAQAKTDKEL